MKRVIYYLVVAVAFPILLALLIASLLGQGADRLGAGIDDVLTDMEENLDA